MASSASSPRTNLKESDIWGAHVILTVAKRVLSRRGRALTNFCSVCVFR
jgi:hypothetical protein